MRIFTLVTTLSLISISAWPDSGPSACSTPKIESTTDTQMGPERMQLTFEWSDLAAAPSWQPGKGEVPLSPAKAIALVSAAFGVDTKLSVQTLTLESTQCEKNGPYWYYNVTVHIKNLEDDDYVFRTQPVVVLLNGKVVRAVRVEDGF